METVVGINEKGFETDRNEMNEKETCADKGQLPPSQQLKVIFDNAIMSLNFSTIKIMNKTFESFPSNIS